MNAIIECTHLTKKYGTGTVALDDVNLRVEAGSIHGLVGRNGAGKTTLMKCLINLIRPTSGSIRILGHHVTSVSAGENVGSLIEEPAYYPYLSGRKNLELFSTYFGADQSECDYILELVGLASRGNDKVKRYSLGMKQRLGVAIALLGIPPILILDEPVNGLDPQAIVHMREMMRDLRNEGITILLSSHLLGEIEQLCDTISILDSGKLVVQGTSREISSHFNAQAPLEITVDDALRAAQALELLGLHIDHDGFTMLRIDLPQGVSTTPILNGLLAAGIEIHSINRKDSLEDAYMAMTRQDA